MHGKRGRAVGNVSLQAYQLVTLMLAVWKSPDRMLLEYLFPITMKCGREMLPVSANQFRPLMQGSGGGKRGEGMLHGRTSSLIEILTLNEKFQFSLAVLRNVRICFICVWFC